MTRVVIRVDASQRMGHGHVMRCLSLALALRQRSADVLFVCRAHTGHLSDVIASQGFAVHMLPMSAPAGTPALHATWLGGSPEDDAAATRAAAAGFGTVVDWLITDHYAIDASWERAALGIAKRMMAIDDLANRSHVCDVLLDQNYVDGMTTRYDGLVTSGCVRLIGPTYSLLQPDYAEYHDRIPPRRGGVRTVLVAFGGADTENLSERALAVVLRASEEVDIDVVLSKNSTNAASVAARSAGHSRVRVHEGLPSMAEAITRADIGIGAGGTSTWERLCLGLPSLVITTAANQRPSVQALNDIGLVRWLGDVEAVTDGRLAFELNAMLCADADEAWSRRCMELVDGRGARRVAAVLTASGASPLTLRHAVLQDEERLLAWANDPATRRNSFCQDVIKPTSHRDWFRGRLRDVEGCELYVAETDGEPIGLVRFERSADEWEVHYVVSPSYRQRGLGGPMLSLALLRFGKKYAGKVVVGHVKADNVASRRIFESLGFECNVEGDGATLFTATT